MRATDVNPDKRPADGGAFLEELRALSEKLDPRKRQLSLELDLPPIPLKAPVRERAKQSRKEQAKPIAQVEGENEMAKAKSEKKEKQSRKVSPRVQRNRRIAALIALILLGTTWYVIAGPGSKVQVPSLAGYTVKGAKAELSDLGIKLEIDKEEFSEDVAEGKIISSSPAGGGRVDPNGVVTVTVSKGKERFIIPDLVGLKPEVAQSLIEENKLKVAEIIEEFSSEIGKGLILRTSPASGERVKRETSLTLYVSKGVEQLALGEYKGKSGEQALNELAEAGFDVETKYIFSEDLPAGVVVSQTPGSGEADKGSKVILIVSKGTEYVFIPKNLFAQSEATAVAALKDLDLKVTVKKVGTKKNKVVTNVVPKVGSKVKRGSTVTITVG